MFLEIFFCFCGIVLGCLCYNKIKICRQQQHESEQVIPMPRMVVPSPLVQGNLQNVDLENQPH